MEEPSIRVRNLAFTHPGRELPAIGQVSFEVARGEALGFLGSNGAGKTTTQRVLIGLLEGWTGGVQVLGREDLRYFASLHAGPSRSVGEPFQSVGVSEVADAPWQLLEGHAGPSESRRCAADRA